MPSSAETGLSAEAGALAVVLRSNDQLVDLSRFSEVGFDAAVDAMADATRSALVSDIKCFVSWCRSRREPVRVVPADPEDIVHYLRWLQAGSKARRPSKPATLDRRVASIARLHRMLGFGDREALPTRAGMVRDTLKAARTRRGQRQRQAAPLRLGVAMGEGDEAPEGVTIQALIGGCGTDLVSLRDAALLSLGYGGGLRVSELTAAKVDHFTWLGNGSGRFEIVRSKTDQAGKGVLVWVSPSTAARIKAWLKASDIAEGHVFRRVNVLRDEVEGFPRTRCFVGKKPLSRQGVVGILRRRILDIVDRGLVELGDTDRDEMLRAVSSHSLRVGLTQDLFAAGEDGAGIALALRWSSPTTALRYARELAVSSNAAARVLGSLSDGL